MKIAFVGKGGSGKSTLSALFSLYLQSKNYTVALFDVDVNAHTSELLGIDHGQQKELHYKTNPQEIRTYLQGDNPRISPEEFLKTTPPGTGSRLVRLERNDPLINKYSTRFGRSGFFLSTGSYKPDEIGSSCHHTTQSIAENVLWHTDLRMKDVAVIDCVAGNDIFANSLYLQDLIIFSLKPEREGISVLRRFIDLAKAAGVDDSVFVIGSQVATVKQKEFIVRESNERLVGFSPLNDDITEGRMEGQPLKEDCITPELQNAFAMITEKLEKLNKSPDESLRELHHLHVKEARADWVAKTYRIGLEDQIDESFRFKQGNEVS